MKYGFVKVAAAVPTVKVADVEYNLQQIESLIAQAEGRGIEMMVFPELCLTGYTCQDLFKEQLLLDGRGLPAVFSRKQSHKWSISRTRTPPQPLFLPGRPKAFTGRPDKLSRCKMPRNPKDNLRCCQI